ncbi:glycosyl hydrolase family 18 protein [Cyclobacteriaceae bacterium]|nr:glycosyl hydrolase family 18 protein [Cyclobacteriaceae bacterium]
MKRIIFSSLFFVLATSVFSQTILGYLPSYRDPSTVQYDKLTDVVFSFINPTTTGNLITNNSVAEPELWGFDMNRFLTAKNGANTAGINLWVALGGADGSERRSARLKLVTGNTNYRITLINDLIDFANTHNLYGVSIDWEFPKDATAKNSHETFLRELKTAIASSSRPNLKVSIAVGGETLGTVNHTQYINANAIQYADEVHVMAYDFPSNNYDNNNHSTLADAQTSFNGWSSFGVPKEKMILCMPFYGRTADRSAVIEYSSIPGNTTTYNSDVYNGYYYNGKPTLEAKTDFVMTEGGMGVAIWDLGQDKSGQYSLLDVVYEKMNSLCAAPQPRLGPDQGVCGTINITLDANVAAASGRTFSWTRDGVSIAGSSSTLPVTQEGVYEVTVSQSSCDRTDAVEVANGSPLTATGAEGCQGDDLSLSVNNASGNDYEWFDDASLANGVKVHEGATYTVSNAQNTSSFYVQEKTGAVTHNDLGLDAPNLPTAQVVAFGRLAQWVEVYTDITITNVDVWHQGSVTGAKLVVVNELGNIVASSTPIDLVGQGAGVSVNTPMSINVPVGPGQYFVSVVGTGGVIVNQIGQPLNSDSKNIGGETVVGQEIAGVIFMEGTNYWDWNISSSTGAHGTWSTSQRGDGAKVDYGMLFNLSITAGAASNCPRAEATMIVNACEAVGVTINSPANNATTGADVSFVVDVTGDITTVVYEINDGVSTTTVNASALNNYNLDYTFPNDGAYTITVRATDVNSAEATDVVSITVSIASGLEGVVSRNTAEVFPNPTSSTLNIANLNTSVEYVIVDSKGVEVQSGLTTGSVNVMELESGLYIIQIQNELGVNTASFIKK